MTATIGLADLTPNADDVTRLAGAYVEFVTPDAVWDRIHDTYATYGRAAAVEIAAGRLESAGWSLRWMVAHRQAARIRVAELDTASRTAAEASAVTADGALF